jgi:hypothetical protein
MSARKLQAGDRVAFKVKGRRFVGVVQDFLAFMQGDAIPVRKRKRTYWLPRTEVRKLPGEKKGGT